MGQEDVVEPPKKKLKQAQLSFCSTPISLKNKTGQKRKLNDEIIGSNGLQSCKIVCRESSLDEEEKNTNDSQTETIVLDDSNDKTEENGPSTISNHSEVNKTQNIDGTSNINKTEHVPNDEEKENHNSSLDAEVTQKNITGESTLSLSLDIDSVVPEVQGCNSSFGSNSDDGADSPSKDENGGDKTANSKMDVSILLNDSKEDLEDDSKETEDKKETSFTTDISVKTVTDTDSDNAEVEVTTPTSNDDCSMRTPKRKLTPKQLQKKAESEKKKMERERIKKEKQEEKAKVREERLQKIAQKNDERRRRKEEKEKKRQAEIMQKNEEKRLKDEEKKKKEEAKEEEKKKKEEAKLLERKKESQARAAFASFFVPKKFNSGGEKIEDTEEEVIGTNFMPFPVKQDMRLADVARSVLSQENRVKLDSLCGGMSEENDLLYLRELKLGKHIPKSSEATWPLSAWQEEQHDVIIIESVGNEASIDEDVGGNSAKIKCNKAKLLQFHDNRRPPYWGTWRKESKMITPRKPFFKDKEFFDYEVDSDSEWEDEEEGESLEGGDDADKEQSDEEEGDGENGYLLDKTFVPHGYLSDEEAQAKDEDISPEEQKLRMILLKEEFDEEMNQKAERLKPRLLGCVWISNETTEVSSGSLYEKLLLYRAVWDEKSGPIDLSSVGENESPSGTPLAAKVKQFPLSVVEPLVKLVHGSQLPLSQLVNEFLKQLEKDYPTQFVTKRAVSRKIKDIAKRSYDCNGRQAWSVNADFCSEFGLKSFSGIKVPSSNLPATPGKIINDKPKKTMLDSFLRGETPQSSQKQQVVKKRVQLTTLPKTPLSGGVVDLTLTDDAPKQNVEPKQNVIKKRVPLITLSRTPEVTKQSQTVHQDTPRPTVNPFSSFMKIIPKENNETSGDTNHQ